MNKLIKCQKYVPTMTERTSPSIIRCPNCSVELIFSEQKGVYYQCISCGAVFSSHGIIPCEQAEELFPDDIIMDY